MRNLNAFPKDREFTIETKPSALRTVVSLKERSLKERVARIVKRVLKLVVIGRFKAMHHCQKKPDPGFYKP